MRNYQGLDLHPIANPERSQDLSFFIPSLRNYIKSGSIGIIHLCILSLCVLCALCG